MLYADGSACVLMYAEGTAWASAVYDVDSACPGFQQVTVDLTASGTPHTVSGIFILLACNENSGSWSSLPNDCWSCAIKITGGGSSITRVVNDVLTYPAGGAGPGVQATWCVRAIQKVDEATNKIQLWDGPDSDNLTLRLSVNDTANAEADNIWVGFRMIVAGDVTSKHTLDNFTLVTP